MDYFTKWPRAQAVPDQSAIAVAAKLLEFFCWFRTFEQMHSDQGRNFEAQVFGKVHWWLRYSRPAPHPFTHIVKGWSCELITQRVHC